MPEINDIGMKAQDCEAAKSGFCCYCENMAYEQLRRNVSNLLVEAQSKSEQLSFSEFKQYFDEDFIPNIWEMMI